MNWLLVNKFGFNPDLYNGTAGNNLALQLVMDGLKLQPANPSMLEGRDAILLADQILTGGANQQEIWTAFARRGMGLSAFDGGSGNAINVVEAFDVPVFGTGQTVTVSINAASISENGGATTATISRSGPTDSALIVSLLTSDSGEAIAVPPVVNIPAGQSSVTFQIVAVDDTVADGTQTVIITPLAPGFDSVTDTVDVLDDETPALTLAISAASIREDGGPRATFGTVTRNTPTDEDLVVFLTSHDQSEAVMTSIVPARSTFGELTSLNDDRGSQTNVGTSTASALAGQVNPDGVIRLSVTGFDDFGFDGTHLQAGGYELFVRVGTGVFPSPFDPNNFTFRRTDSLTPGTLDFFSFAGLTPGVPFIAWINNNIGSGTPDTVLGDFASFPSVTPPVLSAVLIPAGQSSATFPIGTPNELLPDGTQTVAIMATAPGFASGTDTLDVEEVDNVKIVRALRRREHRAAAGPGDHPQQPHHQCQSVSASWSMPRCATREAGRIRAPCATRAKLNVERWVPGVVVENNVLAFNGAGGISFSGDAEHRQQSAGGQSPSAGSSTTRSSARSAPRRAWASQIQDNASPTVLNNIVSRLAVGVSISADSRHHRARRHAVSSRTPRTPTRRHPSAWEASTWIWTCSRRTIPLFRNPSLGDFTLVEGSLAIDSSIDSLSDRPELVAVTQPLGISQSPILAPELDQLGRLRIDNPLVASPPGLGFNVFKDRGALERLGSRHRRSFGCDDLGRQLGQFGGRVHRVAVRSAQHSVHRRPSPRRREPLRRPTLFRTAGTITFLPGQTTQLVTVSVVGDQMDEDDETFFLNLVNAGAGAAITDFLGQATIVDDDNAPTLSVTDQSVFEGRLAGPGQRRAGALAVDSQRTQGDGRLQYGRRHGQQRQRLRVGRRKRDLYAGHLHRGPDHADPRRQERRGQRDVLPESRQSGQRHAGARPGDDHDPRRRCHGDHQRCDRHRRQHWFCECCLHRQPRQGAPAARSR